MRSHETYWYNPKTRSLQHKTELPHVAAHSDAPAIHTMSHNQIDEMMKKCTSSRVVTNTTPFMQEWVKNNH